MEFNEEQEKVGGNDSRRWMGLGIEFGGVIAVFCFMGYLLDKKLNSSPWFLLIGFFVAFIGMFYMIVKDLVKRN